MDSPETAKSTSTIPLSDSPPVQESPVFNYISKLSPIKSFKAAHVAEQGFPGLSSPPPVFTSPRINPHYETSFQKRHQNPQLSSEEISPNDDRGKRITPGPDEPKQSATQLCCGLTTDTTKDSDIKDSTQAQPCNSSGHIDEYLADPVEVGCANSVNPVNPSSEQCNDGLQSSLSGSTDSKKTSKFDNKNETGKDARMEANAPLVLSELSKEDLLGNPTYHVQPIKSEEEKIDGECPSDECAKVAFDSSVDHAPMKQQSEDLGAQNGPAYEHCGETVGAISNEPVENTKPQNPKASQSQCVMRRRCLQFEDAQLNTIANNTSSLKPKCTVTSSRLPATGAESENLDLSHLDSDATSSRRQLVKLSQPMTILSPPSHSGNSPITVSTPSGIGLHLNSVLNAVPMGRCATASMKLTEEYNSVLAVKSASSMSCYLLESVRSCPIPLNVVEKVSATAEDVTNKTKALTAASCASSMSPLTVEPLIMLKPVELNATSHNKRKFNSEQVDNFEEYNGKRKKTSSSIDGDGCKRCNCKKTNCLKLYCDCFASGIYCAEPCACQGCFNRPEYEDTVLDIRQKIESRNPLAFAPKIVQSVTEFPAYNGDDGNTMTPSSTRHKRGCNCKKSMCLKKYCECYQANVGCSSGCRCEGCKNVFGRKEEYDTTQEMVSHKVSRERSNCTFVEKLELVATKEDLICTELYDSHNLIPGTPSFQCSDHGNDTSKSLSMRYLPSDYDLTTLSSYATTTRTHRNSNDNDVFLETSKEILGVGSDDGGIYYNNAEIMDQFSPRYVEGNMYQFTPPQNLPSAAMAPASSKTTGGTNVSHVQLCPGSNRLSSGDSLRRHSSPITPMTQLSRTKSLQGLNSEIGLYDTLEDDDTPEILKETSTLIKSVKASSPNKKRVSPPHSHAHERGSSSSAGLRSGRKFILKAVPSFPPLTPCIDSKSRTNQHRNDLQDDSDNK